MVYDLDTSHGLLEAFTVADVTINQGRVKAFEPFDARIASHQAANFVTALDERRGEMRSDESACASY